MSARNGKRHATQQSLNGAQAVTLAFAGGDFGLLPLGLALFAILSLPAIGLAYAGARLGSRKDDA